MNPPLHFINTVLPDKDSRFTIKAILVGDPETYDVRMTFLLCLLKHHNHAVRPADQHLSNALNAEVLGLRGSWSSATTTASQRRRSATSPT